MAEPLFGFRGSPSTGVRFCSNGVCSYTYMFERRYVTELNDLVFALVFQNYRGSVYNILNLVTTRLSQYSVVLIMQDLHHVSCAVPADIVNMMPTYAALCTLRSRCTDVSLKSYLLVASIYLEL